MRIAAYVYPGWHSIPERDESFHPGFTEWELVTACQPRFDEHHQPRTPLLGSYDDRDPDAVGARVRLAREHGVDALIYGFFWCRGKRVFQDALDLGFLGAAEGTSTPFALMWANRMPRRVLPVRRSDVPVIDEARRVTSDEDDFVAFVLYVAERYFVRDNYIRVNGAAYLSIFDTTFFIRELGVARARSAVAAARRALADAGLPPLHLVAIDPSAEVIGALADIGFDEVTHYVHLPDWKGPPQQDYTECARKRSLEWASFARKSRLQYVPSVSPGWDASPRAADFAETGRVRPDKYPWSPVVTGESPERFHDVLMRAVVHAELTATREPMVMIASLNEWSEGHYLEPDERFGHGWLEAVRAAR